MKHVDLRLEWLHFYFLFQETAPSKSDKLPANFELDADQVIKNQEGLQTIYILPKSFRPVLMSPTLDQK